MLYNIIVIHLNMNSKELIKTIVQDGWQLVRTKGSHHHFKHTEKKGLVTVPHPKKDIPIKTAKSILKQAGIK
jgi:predicted RNA binding protein YcfA (HicA-like mRNA interferase family)